MYFNLSDGVYETAKLKLKLNDTDKAKIQTLTCSERIHPQWSAIRTQNTEFQIN